MREGAGFDDHARRGTLAPAMAATVAVERRGLGQAGDDGRHLGGERLRVGGDLDAGARHGAGVGPDRCRSRSRASRRRPGCCANAPPMMPRPITRPCPSPFPASVTPTLRRRTLHSRGRCASSMCRSCTSIAIFLAGALPLSSAVTAGSTRQMQGMPRGQLMTISRNTFGPAPRSSVALTRSAAASAQGLITEHRLSAVAGERSGDEAVAVCVKTGYAVTAIIVDIEGVRQAVLRGDGAAVHTLDSAYVKAYTAASLAPVRKETRPRRSSSACQDAGHHHLGPGEPAQRHLHAGRRHHHGGRRSRSAASVSVARPAAISTTIAPGPRSTRSRTG